MRWRSTALCFEIEAILERDVEVVARQRMDKRVEAVVNTADEDVSNLLGSMTNE